MPETIKDILIRRDGMTEQEALELIGQAETALEEYLLQEDLDGAECICQEYFGLEADYLEELL